MKIHYGRMSFRRIKRGYLLLSFISLWMICGTASAKTIHTSTGGTAGSPLNWSAPASWSNSGSGTPHVYVIRNTDYINFDQDNSSPYIDTVFIYGRLIMANNKVMTLTATGVLQLLTNSSQIEGGSNNTQFVWNGTSGNIIGPFTSTNIITNGPRYATANTAILAAGDPQGSFVNGTLPVKLVNFTSACAGEKIQVNWSCVLDETCAGFELLASSDGKDWTHVYFQTPDGLASELKNYQYKLNRESLFGSTGSDVFFKLKIMEKNGNFEFFKIIQTSCDDKITGTDAVVNMFPNPSVGLTTVTLENFNQGSGQVFVYNEAGLLCSYVECMVSSTDPASVVISGLKTGVYKVQVVLGTTIKTLTLIQL